ncbi:6-phosphogluconate dehydrogenase C-terminal domain-like protein [Xylariomycetidae sp. FL0641]|nr:6-phosphogluconate dehydrogenase C-terminal domain-like protein [Xylariomycetidae sp. FL0641]
MASPLTKIGIISMGEMGVGIARLLIANGFSVATNCRGRSEDTIARAKDAQVELLASDEGMVQSCATILSVVPPRDAVATAQRILDAATGPFPRPADAAPLYFADLNAVSPATARSIAGLFAAAPRANVRFVDGAIIGAPPASPAPSPSGSSSSAAGDGWSVPSIPTSGPHGLDAALAAALRSRHLGPDVGAASALKMCFAALTKGFTALALQSFGTAHRAGVLAELQGELAAHTPALHAVAARGVVNMPPKAYRWAGEMRHIAATLAEDGGFPPDAFDAAAEVYRTVAEDTVLGREKAGKRKRGLDVPDVAAALAEGMATKRKKND